MAVKMWQTIKVSYCQRADKEVSLEAELLYPDEHLPDQPPRIIAHRCAYGLQCNLNMESGCVWAGTHPTYDPFAEAQAVPKDKGKSKKPR